MKKERDARRWPLLCESVQGPKVASCGVKGQCYWMVDGWKLNAVPLFSDWRVSVDPDGIAWTWSTT